MSSDRWAINFILYTRQTVDCTEVKDTVGFLFVFLCAALSYLRLVSGICIYSFSGGWSTHTQARCTIPGQGRPRIFQMESEMKSQNRNFLYMTQ